ncbi:YggS family pyridoxal phosphate-dependent enzyme [Methylohalobius crimeensis]|uniref:YggS family pyridoxal phosphate-dependent enzyme n=1 Tax=Methylohalobius crimeensis TaxID=244365 RepID=UPI0003B2EA6C|nr:YggS family pyridoxal phosphate-dependent enzyme [Methylohalobius crimeensis]
MTIQQRLQKIQQRIRSALEQAGRDTHVTLVAVGKTQPPRRLLEAYRLGVCHFGENYLQEALAKQKALSHCQITWHFIGPIQSNKTRDIAAHFAWVHGVDRLKIARRLSEQRPDWLPPLNICLQVNVSGEESKSGVSPPEVTDFARAVGALPRLRLRGLMALPAPAEDFEAQRRPFQRLYGLYEELADLGLDTLSMGMSTDMEAAVSEGATMVRIGTALFGPRQKTV